MFPHSTFAPYSTTILRSTALHEGCTFPEEEEEEELREGYAERRVQYSQWLQRKPQAFMSQIIMRNEAIFQLNGNVSNHNVNGVRYALRGDPPEDFVYDKSSSGEKLVVWIWLVRNNLIGPYFFDGNVNGQAYLEILNHFVLPQVENIFGVNQNGSIPRAYGSRMEPQDIL